MIFISSAIALVSNKDKFDKGVLDNRELLSGFKNLINGIGFSGFKVPSKLNLDPIDRVQFQYFLLFRDHMNLLQCDNVLLNGFLFTYLNNWVSKGNFLDYSLI